MSEPIQATRSIPPLPVAAQTDPVVIDATSMKSILDAICAVVHLPNGCEETDLTLTKLERRTDQPDGSWYATFYYNLPQAALLPAKP